MGERLAVDGGKPVRTKPFPKERKVGERELKEVAEALESAWLFRWSGSKVAAFERAFAQRHGVPYGVACTSGTAAIHLAIAALQLEPGDEIITAPITDVGTVAPILKEGGIPLFADVDPETGNMDPEKAKQLISERTKAILVVHLAGNPCDLGAFENLAKEKGLILIEDCAQAHLAEYHGRLVGTIGHIGCFSLQQSKHIVTGDGGISITADEELATKMALFMDKGWDRGSGTPHRVYKILGLNYRMNELTGAVALAQMERLDLVVSERRKRGDRLSQLISECRFVKPQKVLDGCQHSYWHYQLLVQREAPFTADDFAQALQAEGIPCGARYIGKPIFLCHDAITNKRIFGHSSFPFDHNPRQVVYNESTCPIAQDYLSRLVVLPLHEFLSEEEITDMAQAIIKVDRNLRR
ncbi:MAG: DegT/DnrJ/EryC1/StrS family aminotransferase [Armatimonadetes bacterium]|nr:DegT/DnrJ/EryC1/StrS family aminotransferase [Armatimonadota bacterium]MDW8121415.1 DegT/DnrJ/EryC1/StrS family aminotransferase [Armatimonadota bacterium]